MSDECGGLDVCREPTYLGYDGTVRDLLASYMAGTVVN
jgi:hypothetical protein